MARWGRAADIEWAYEFRAVAGKVLEERYQAVAHQIKPFKGAHLNGDHPALVVASDNNNFSDEAMSAVRFALLPIAADLRNASRESVMDANPWTYRAVAEELGTAVDGLGRGADRDGGSAAVEPYAFDDRITIRRKAIVVGDKIAVPDVVDERVGDVPEVEEVGRALQIEP